MLSCEIIGFLGSDAKKTEKGCSFNVSHKYREKGTDKTLFELGSKKTEFSARKLALENFKKNKKVFSKKITEIKPWTGSYQH